MLLVVISMIRFVLVNLVKKEIDAAVNNIAQIDSKNSYHHDIMDFQSKEIDNLRIQSANAN